MDKKLNFAVIGAGSFSDKHLSALEQTNEANVVAICDCVQEKANQQAEKYHIPDVYTDYNELLSRRDIDVVTLPLPDQVHREITVAALRAGKHVLCEKPMALSLEDCREMVQAQRGSGKQLMIGQVCRFTPGFVLAKQLVEAGEIGDLFFIESEYAHDYSKLGGEGGWRVTPERHPVIGGGCHAVDLLRWIAGNPTELFAYANNKVLTSWPICDCTVALLQFPNQVSGKILTSIGCKRNYTMRTVLYGTKGTIITDNTSPTISIFKEAYRDADMFHGIDQQSIEMKLPVEVNNHNVPNEIRVFCDAILHNKPVPTDGVEGASTVAVCRTIVESAKLKQPLPVDYNF